MPYTLPFSDLNRQAVPQVGGKGANLGEMVLAGLPVPPGFAVTAEAYRRFLEENALTERLEARMQGLDVRDAGALGQASRDLQQDILAGRMPIEVARAITEAYQQLGLVDPFVAVRSSATMEDSRDASFAGMNQTFLNVRGAEDLLRKVQACWASLFGQRVLFYMKERGLVGMPLMGVVVQRMVDADKAGVMFTANPTTGAEDELVIDAARGLGEVVVAGQVETDAFRVAKADMSIRDRAHGDQDFKLVRDETGETRRVPVPEDERAKPVLTDDEVRSLAELGRRVEAHYHAPQDIEWAIAGDRLFLVQTRPITTLAAPERPPAEAEGQLLVAGRPASPGVAMGRVRILCRPEEGAKLQDGEVLVTPMTSPDWVPIMRRAAAIVTDSGGMTSHAAIVSRELGVPCIVGAAHATERLHDGQEVTVDATQGQVRAGLAQRETPQAAKGLAAPVTFLPEATATSLLVNLGVPACAAAAAALPVDGVGLLRAEFMLLEALAGIHPRRLVSEGRADALRDQLADGIRTIAQAFHPRPVTYRTMDFKSNEFRHLQGGEAVEPKEANPMIGYRGCFRYVNEPDLFRLELEAVQRVRQEGLTNVHVMLPFGRTRWEVARCVALVREVGLMADRQFKLWLMAEVPSVVYWLPDYAELGIGGVSIGSNDLTQLVLGVDRDSSELAPLYDERDPAVLDAIRQIITLARRLGLASSICGQAPSVYPDYAAHLVEWGIGSISVNPDAVESAHRHIAAAEKRMLLEEARRHQG